MTRTVGLNPLCICLANAVLSLGVGTMSFGQPTTPWASMMPSPRTLPRGSPPAELPFAAEIEAEHLFRPSEGMEVSFSIRGRIYRNGRGEVRQELQIEARKGVEVETGHLGTITTPDAAVLLDHDNRLVFERKVAPATTQAIRSWVFPGSHYRVEAEDVLTEGYSCRRIRYWTEGHDRQSLEGNVWIAEQLGEVVREEGRSQTEHYEWKMFNVRVPEEPEASLFRVPADYRIVRIDQENITGPFLSQPWHR